MDWEDLKVMLAVARAGTLHGAAQALSVNATTVSRRLKALEDNTGARLFEKLKHGAVLTEAGDDMAQVAEQIDQLVHDLDARLQGRDAKLEGQLRATFTDLALLHWLPDLAAFKEIIPTVKAEGVAFDQEENEENLMCIAAPVFNHLQVAIASISVSFPIFRSNEEIIARYQSELQNAAAKLSGILGYRQLS